MGRRSACATCRPGVSRSANAAIPREVEAVGAVHLVARRGLQDGGQVDDLPVEEEHEVARPGGGQRLVGHPAQADLERTLLAARRRARKSRMWSRCQTSAGSGSSGRCASGLVPSPGRSPCPAPRSSRRPLTPGRRRTAPKSSSRIRRGHRPARRRGQRRRTSTPRSRPATCVHRNASSRPPPVPPRPSAVSAASCHARVSSSRRASARRGGWSARPSRTDERRSEQGEGRDRQQRGDPAPLQGPHERPGSEHAAAEGRHQGGPEQDEVDAAGEHPGPGGPPAPAQAVELAADVVHGPEPTRRERPCAPAGGGLPSSTPWQPPTSSIRPSSAGSSRGSASSWARGSCSGPRSTSARRTR